MSTGSDFWVVRAGRGGVHGDEFEKEKVVALGWPEVGNLSSLSSRGDFNSRIRMTYPTWKNGRQISTASQLYRFAREIDKGDFVLTPVSDTRTIKIGRIIGDYEFHPDVIDDHPHTRAVEWDSEISRDDLSVPARNSAGSSLTLFSMNDHKDEIQSILAGEDREISEEDEEAGKMAFYEAVSGQADELISDRIAHMDPFDFEELVSAVLRAMGYHARVTESGADRGVDIIAHPDPLGLEDPMIKVQVKQREQRTGSPEMRNFIATLRDGERGIFVSTGGYTREAVSEAEHARGAISVTTLDRDKFVDLLTEHYDEISPDARALIPLRRVYIPTD